MPYRTCGYQTSDVSYALNLRVNEALGNGDICGFWLALHTAFPSPRAGGGGGSRGLRYACYRASDMCGPVWTVLSRTRSRLRLSRDREQCRGTGWLGMFRVAACWPGRGLQGAVLWATAALSSLPVLVHACAARSVRPQSPSGILPGKRDTETLIRTETLVCMRTCSIFQIKEDRRTVSSMSCWFRKSSWSRSV
jgi:hypothetical protein